jgi:predicted nuclease of predicted toxin-antitoxin system
LRLKLDENVPATARAEAQALGHDVDTVIDEGLAGASDRDLLAQAAGEGRIIVTLDKGFGDVRRYPPGSHPGIVVLRGSAGDPASVAESFRSFLVGYDLAEFEGCVVAVRSGSIGVRRPT